MNTTTTTKPASGASKKRPFGDGMAKEGEITHIPAIIMAMYALLLVWSCVVAHFTGGSWYTQAAFYFAYMAIFYVWHWAAHERFIFGLIPSPMNPIHMQHHLSTNPVNRFYSTDEMNIRKYGSATPSFWAMLNPRASTNFTIAHEGPLYFGNFFTLFVAYFALGVGVADIAAALLLAVVIGAIGSALHSSFHVRSFWLARYAWYRELRALHFLHHTGDQKSNLAVFNMSIDQMFSSLLLDDPMRKQKKTDGDGDDKELVLSKALLKKVMANGRGASFLLLNDIGGTVGEEEFERLRVAHTGWPSSLCRLLALGIMFYLWLHVEPLLRTHADLPFTDAGHALFAPLRQYAVDHNAVATLCTLSTLLSESSAWILVVSSLFATTKPLVTALAAYLLRFALLLLNPGIPMPHSSVPWVSNQHLQLLTAVASSSTAICVRVMTAGTFFLMVWKFEWFSRPVRNTIRVASGLVLAFQIAMTLAFQTNWSADVGVALMVAFAASHFARHGAQFLDHGLP